MPAPCSTEWTRLVSSSRMADTIAWEVSARGSAAVTAWHEAIAMQVAHVANRRFEAIAGGRFTGPTLARLWGESAADPEQPAPL